MPTTFHKPRTGQIAVMTITPSSLCQDMRTVESAEILLYDGSTTKTLDAELGVATAESVNVEHTWDASKGELQTAGSYIMWSLCTLDGGVVVPSEPFAFTIIEDWVTSSQ